jgi:putative membrane protein
MNAVAQIGAILAGLVHVLIFGMESVLFSRGEVYERFLTRVEDVPAVRPWARNQGFYNLFLAAGAIGGVIVLRSAGTADATTSGKAIALFACACMAGAALVLLASDRRMLRGAVIQGLFPAIALLAALL